MRNVSKFNSAAVDVGGDHSALESGALVGKVSLGAASKLIIPISVRTRPPFSFFRMS